MVKGALQKRACQELWLFSDQLFFNTDGMTDKRMLQIISGLSKNDLIHHILQKSELYAQQNTSFAIFLEYENLQKLILFFIREFSNSKNTYGLFGNSSIKHKPLQYEN